MDLQIAAISFIDQPIKKEPPVSGSFCKNNDIGCAA
tara:strand:+ start:116 stop:223 length:108 start_codon:yes stop_codon:yes gene_type:complete